MRIVGLDALVTPARSNAYTSLAIYVIIGDHAVWQLVKRPALCLHRMLLLRPVHTVPVTRRESKTCNMQGRQSSGSYPIGLSKGVYHSQGGWTDVAILTTRRPIDVDFRE